MTLGSPLGSGTRAALHLRGPHQPRKALPYTRPCSGAFKCPERGIGRHRTVATAKLLRQSQTEGKQWRAKPKGKKKKEASVKVESSILIILMTFFKMHVCQEIKIGKKSVANYFLISQRKRSINQWVSWLASSLKRMLFS